jgi:CRISPR-associated endonuclease/helicase Cas3
MTCWAHSPNEAGLPHDLAAHLTAVAGLARDFATRFGAGGLAHWAGLCHDLGKFSDDFQRYLADPEYRRRAGHSRPSGRSIAGQVNRLDLAYGIAGGPLVGDEGARKAWLAAPSTAVTAEGPCMR